jgi:nucleoside triphosphate pyrophosphatase
MGRQLPFRLILASGSRDRRRLLAEAGYAFEVIPANIDEPAQTQFGDIRHFVADVAWRKAAAVAGQIDSGLVLAADTVGWHSGQVIGKPADEADARRIIRELAGTVHELWTGVCLWKRPENWQICWQEVSKCTVKAFTAAELDAYIATNRWVGCSGAYSIDGENDPYVRVVEGSITNVIGLPMESLTEMLELACVLAT